MSTVTPPGAEHAKLILRTAPRHWLHNAGVAAEEGRLREAERCRTERIRGRVAEEVAAARERPTRVPSFGVSH